MKKMKIRWGFFFLATVAVAFAGCVRGIRGVDITQSLAQDPDYMETFMPQSARNVDELKLGGIY